MKNHDDSKTLKARVKDTSKWPDRAAAKIYPGEEFRPRRFSASIRLGAGDLEIRMGHLFESHTRPSRCRSPVYVGRRLCTSDLHRPLARYQRHRFLCSSR